jgi:hypothetical protein
MDHYERINSLQGRCQRTDGCYSFGGHGEVAMSESAERQAAELPGKQHPRTPVQINQTQPRPLVGQIGTEGRSNAPGGTGDYDRAIQNFHGASSFCLPSIFPVLYRTAIGAGGTALERSGTKFANRRSSLQTRAGFRHGC